MVGAVEAGLVCRARPAISISPTEEIPFGIPGCSYAVAPFTHVNLDGSRFSDGSFGVLYVGDTIATALAEVQHHQETYWRNVPDLSFERFVFRGLALKEEGAPGLRDPSARAPGATCWGLMTPRPVTAIVQTAHYEMIWSGSIVSVNRMSPT